MKPKFRSEKFEEKRASSFSDGWDFSLAAIGAP
jgi:hypothetical protein